MSKEVKEAYWILGGGMLATVFLAATVGVWHQQKFICGPLDQKMLNDFNIF